ncbi:MAG: tetratricopeptide repeat protein [Planctomycetota bacterium]
MSEDSRKFCDLGEAHLKRDEPEEALQWYERAVQEDPENPEAWSGRGRACYHLGQLERADRCFRRALRFSEPGIREHRPRRGWWNDERGRTYLRLVHWRALCRFWMGLYEEAARLFRRILKLAPSDPLEVRFLLGETYFRMGDLDRAVEEFERAGDDPDAVYNLGLCWFYQGDFVRSVNAFRRGIFENVYLACRLADLDPPPEVPMCRATHPKELDHEDAAVEYTDRCGDLWLGRPLLQRWIRAIYLHPHVQEDLSRHLAQVRTLATMGLGPGEAAQLEGANAALRNPMRLAQNDPDGATDVMRRVFRPPAES